MIQLIYKTIYHPILNYLLRNINKWLTPILPKGIRIPPSGIVYIRIPSRKTLKIKTNQTNYLTQLIYWEGYENFEYTSIFLKLIKKVQGFYDVGANIGYYSLLAAMENPSIKVTSFEPATGPLKFLRDNIAINGIKNIKVEPIALSKAEGTICFNEVKSRKYPYLKYNLAGTGSESMLNKGESFDMNRVPSTTIEKYFEYNLGPLQLVKMDTEGTEHIILAAAEKILSEVRPIFICETLYKTNENELEIIFKKHGYHFYNHYPNGLRKTDTIVRKEDDGVRNCFFVHPSKYELISEFVI